jgi:hypothetical protein
MCSAYIAAADFNFGVSGNISKLNPVLIIDLKLQNNLVFAIPGCVGDEMLRGFFSRGARVVQRDKLLPFLIDNQAACRRDMGKERCHSLTTREAVAGFRTLPDKTLGSDSKFVTKPMFPKGNGDREGQAFSKIDAILGMASLARNGRNGSRPAMLRRCRWQILTATLTSADVHSLRPYARRDPPADRRGNRPC